MSIRLLAPFIAAVILAPAAHADDWPQWRGPTRDGVWRETGVVEQFETDRLPHVWSAEISSGYSGPTVADGRVYVTDRVSDPADAERVLCFDAKTGEELWIHAYECDYSGVGYPDGPRASVTVAEGLAFSLGTMGHLRCLDAATGKLLWKKDPGVDYDVDRPIWGMAAAPLVDGENLIVQIGAKPDACVVALDKRTGAERWRAIEDGPSYSAPIIIEQAGRRVLVCWTGEYLTGLDPASGAIYWQSDTPPHRMVINVPTPVVDDNRIFVSSFYDGARMFRLGRERLTAERLWERRGKNERQTDALHCMIGTPILDGDYIYGVDSYGQLRCLDASNGDRIWEDLSAVPEDRWATIHMVRNGDKVWMFNDQGELIIAKLSPDGFHEIDRAKLISPTKGQLDRGDGVSWSHPAFANRHIYIRNDHQLVCANLAAD